MGILKTERLFFRTWHEADFPLACRLWGDADVMAFLGGPLSNDNILAKLRAEIACQEKNGVQYWPVFEIQTEEFVGCCGIRPWVYTSEQAFEIGFHLAKDSWGKGYAFEAVIIQPMRIQKRFS